MTRSVALLSGLMPRSVVEFARTHQVGHAARMHISVLSRSLACSWVMDQLVADDLRQEFMVP